MAELMDIVEAEDITLTTKQAIEALEANRPQKGYVILNKATDMAIQTLKEIQQYRAMEEKLNGISVEQVVNGFINTVEDRTEEPYERGRILTNEEADMWNEYKAIGTIEEFKALKEKIEKVEFILNEKKYLNSEECDYGNYDICDNALKIKDIEEIING